MAPKKSQCLKAINSQKRFNDGPLRSSNGSEVDSEKRRRLSYDTNDDDTDIPDLFEEVPDKGLDEEDEVNRESELSIPQISSSSIMAPGTSSYINVPETCSSKNSVASTKSILLKESVEIRHLEIGIFLIAFIY